MPDNTSQDLSVGQDLLLSYGLRQGAAFPASLLDDAALQGWADCRSEEELRRRQLKRAALLVVVSQDCDIACRDDKHDPRIELAIFISIKEKSVHPGNQFANSARKLQLYIRDQYYEAKARETVRVPKEALHEYIAKKPEGLFHLTDEQFRTLVLWRANRYQRAALPDRFNEAINPLFDERLPEIEALSADPENQGRSFIRSIYVFLNTLEEVGDYEFSLLALLRWDTPDDVQLKIDDAMERLCEELEKNPALSLSELDSLAGLAERESTVTVSMLGQYLKINLDDVSLRQGDLDTGV